MIKFNDHMVFWACVCAVLSPQRARMCVRAPTALQFRRGHSWIVPFRQYFRQIICLCCEPCCVCARGECRPSFVLLLFTIYFYFPLFQCHTLRRSFYSDCQADTFRIRIPRLRLAMAMPYNESIYTDTQALKHSLISFRSTAAGGCGGVNAADVCVYRKDFCFRFISPTAELKKRKNGKKWLVYRSWQRQWQWR